LLVALKQAGYRPTGVFDVLRDRALELGRQLGCPGLAGSPELLARSREADIVIVATPDADIERVARLAVSCEASHEHQVWLHLAGARDESALDALKGHVQGTAACHPACAFPHGRISPIPKGTCFGLTGDEAALRVARGLVAALDGVPVEVPAESRARYHAAAVMASNLVVALLFAAKDVLHGLGVEANDAERLVLALGQSALERVAELGLREGLSGPVSRGDAQTIETHLDSLGQEGARALYLELSRAALPLAAQQDGFDEKKVAALRRALLM
jgi:predicted short-subunit dehydrogenase-like oxidoreductase (DUF2520 family)